MPGARDVRFRQQTRAPRDVAHPICVAFQLDGLFVVPYAGVKVPELYRAVAAAACEAAFPACGWGRCRRGGLLEHAWKKRRGPGDAVRGNGVRGDDRRGPGVLRILLLCGRAVVEGKDGDCAI